MFLIAETTAGVTIFHYINSFFKIITLINSASWDDKVIIRERYTSEQAERELNYMRMPGQTVNINFSKYLPVMQI